MVGGGKVDTGLGGSVVHHSNLSTWQRRACKCVSLAALLMPLGAPRAMPAGHSCWHLLACAAGSSSCTSCTSSACLQRQASSMSGAPAGRRPLASVTLWAVCCSTGVPSCTGPSLETTGSRCQQVCIEGLLAGNRAATESPCHGHCLAVCALADLPLVLSCLPRRPGAASLPPAGGGQRGAAAGAQHRGRGRSAPEPGPPVLQQLLHRRTLLLHLGRRHCRQAHCPHHALVRPCRQRRPLAAAWRRPQRRQQQAPAPLPAPAAVAARPQHAPPSTRAAAAAAPAAGCTRSWRRGCRRSCSALATTWCALCESWACSSSRAAAGGPHARRPMLRL